MCIGPVPWPYLADKYACASRNLVYNNCFDHSPSLTKLTALLKEEKPNCLHTTLVSSESQKSSHTVPQSPPLHSSTRP